MSIRQVLGSTGAVLLLAALVGPPTEAAAAARPTWNDRTATIVGTSHGDTIIGTRDRTSSSAATAGTRSRAVAATI